ncbi:MAG: hypothetical protein EZS28_037068, partial [Streblomastix strix]
MSIIGYGDGGTGWNCVFVNVDHTEKM